MLIEIPDNLDLAALNRMVADQPLSPLKFYEREDDDEIMRARLGKVTGSEFGKLIVKTKDRKGYTLSQSKTAEMLLYRAAWERLIPTGNTSEGLRRMNFSAKSTEHGLEHEQEAIQKYMEVTGRQVDYHQKFIEVDQYIGGTPDGYVGNYGLIEVKCPYDGANHIYSYVNRKLYNEEHLYQIQGYLWMTRRRWCDFISYDPLMPKPMQIVIIRVYRDKEIIRGIRQVIKLIRVRIEEMMSEIEKRETRRSR